MNYGNKVTPVKKKVSTHTQITGSEPCLLRDYEDEGLCEKMALGGGGLETVIKITITTHYTS